MHKHQQKAYLQAIAKKILNKSSRSIEEKFLDEYYDSFDKLPEASNAMSREEELALKNEILENIHTRTKTKPSHFSIRRLMPKIAGAAAILIILSAGIYTYLAKKDSDQSLLAVNNIKPGADKATLTLSDGTKILLDTLINGTVTAQTGTSITKTANGQLQYTQLNTETKSEATLAEAPYNTISTPKGGQYHVVLPDGTKVWLNASSSLRFPTYFKSGNRNVYLSGEGYFEVTHQDKTPFQVKTATQTVKVLGTHFNINSYADENTVKTTLLEGAVKISLDANDKISKILHPGQQSINNNKNILVKNADLESVIAWKNGDFMLKNEDFKTTMRKLARWYDIEIVYAADAPEDLELGGWVSRSKNISAVLKLMELTGKVHFKIEGRRITVTR